MADSTVGLRIALAGSSGRMGQSVRDLASEMNCRVAAQVGRVTPITAVDANDIDLVVDFSLPAATREIAAWCAAHRKPLVSGVTGLDDEQHAALRQTATHAPVLWAPNMSLGVAVLARMVRELRRLEGFDLQVEEVHHIHKKDRPSGTALRIQAEIENAVGRKLPEPVAIRGGGVFGIHRIFAMSADETLTLEHSALNRLVFARGALRAAHWLVLRSPGLYTIENVIEP